MKYTKYPELKGELKKLAKEIKGFKGCRKADKRSVPLYEIQGNIDWRKDDFRHKHIAYCMLRGKEYDQIENFCRVSPDFDRINKIMERHAEKTLCASA